MNVFFINKRSLFLKSMAVSRAVTINLEEPDDESKLTLMEKWRKHVEKKERRVMMQK